MTQYERDKVDADTVMELLRGLRGPWVLGWDEKTNTLQATCVCGLNVKLVVRPGTLVRELTKRLAHKC